MIRRVLLGLAVMLSLTACKLQITVPDGGRVVGGGLTCRANTVCTVDVTDTSFDQTYKAIPASDRYTFTGWERGFGQFCGGKTGSCRLTTTLFGDNEALLAILASEEEVYFLTPRFEELSDNLPSGATPIKLSAKSVMRGELGARKVSYDEDSYFGAPIDESDYYVFVAPTSGAVTITLDELELDFDLSLETADRILETSETVGPKSESITASVAEGNTYYINVYPYDETRGDYRLTVNFEAFRPADAPADISGTYEVDASSGFGYCLVDGPILVDALPVEMSVGKDGKFVESMGGLPETDDSRVFREYSNSVANGTVIRKDVYKFMGVSGAPEFILEVLISGEFVENAIHGDRFERYIFFNTAGEKVEDCLISMSYLGRKVAESSDSGGKSLSF